MHHAYAHAYAVVISPPHVHTLHADLQTDLPTFIRTHSNHTYPILDKHSSFETTIYR
jgi:hypothetical protein